MIKRRLGRSELEVAPLAFGGNVFGWTAHEATSHELLDVFVAAGFNLIDTADTYSPPAARLSMRRAPRSSQLEKRACLPTPCGLRETGGPNGPAFFGHPTQEFA
jgi:aryl-alcohol dehydrogenase-like predicted oxidoreductase